MRSSSLALAPGVVGTLPPSLPDGGAGPTPSGDQEAQEVVYEFDVEALGLVRASLCTRDGKRKLDMRVWKESRRHPEAPPKPTRKGIQIPVEYLDDVIEAVAAVVARVRPLHQRRAA